MSGRERMIAGALILAAIASIGFVAAYATHAGSSLEGLPLAVAAAALCAATVGWAFWILPPEQVVDARETLASGLSDRVAQETELTSGMREVTRSGALVRLFYVALGLFAAALVVPLRSLGPRVDGLLFHTQWRRGSRLTREDGRFVRADEVAVDSSVTVFPEHAVGDAQSQAMLIHLPDGAGDSVRGYVAYSKICTHAGCPVALYRAASKQLMCPCHQSVFDVLRNGTVVTGPADHALPRLPIEIGSDGYVRASGDFPAPVGPSFWERGA